MADGSIDAMSSGSDGYDMTSLQTGGLQSSEHIHFNTFHFNSTMRRFRSPIARAAWIDFLIANERDDQAAQLGYTDPFLDPHGKHRPSDAQIERAWLELEAIITVQYHTRAYLENVYYNQHLARQRAAEMERLRMLKLMELFARSEERAARRLQRAARRMLERRRADERKRRAEDRWRRMCDAVQPDPGDVFKGMAAMFARAQKARAYQDERKRLLAQRADILTQLNGTLYELKGSLSSLFRRFEARHVSVEDDENGVAYFCCKPSARTMSGVSSAGSRSSPWQRPEQKVNVSSIKKVLAHSYVRYEFVVDTSERKAPWLFRCVSKRDMDRWQRGFHALQKIEEQIRTLDDAQKYGRKPMLANGANGTTRSSSGSSLGGLLRGSSRASVGSYSSTPLPTPQVRGNVASWFSPASTSTPQSEGGLQVAPVTPPTSLADALMERTNQYNLLMETTAARAQAREGVEEEERAASPAGWFELA